jgi:hypothetical protein
LIWNVLKTNVRLKSLGQVKKFVARGGLIECASKKTVCRSMAWFEEDSHPAETTKVVFRRDGDQYFLSEIWIAGESSHTYRLPSKQEEHEMAANKAVPTEVVVAALEMPR